MKSEETILEMILGLQDVKEAQNIKVKFGWVIPEIATKLLERANKKNRPIADATVAKYKQQMPHWRLNGETIIIGWDGVLLNGQHRLLACIASGVAFPATIIYGIDPDAFGTQDTGKVRRSQDVLGIDNPEGKYLTQLGAAVRVAAFYYEIRKGKIEPEYLTNESTLAFAHSHPDIIEWNNKVNTITHRVLGPMKGQAAIVAAILFLGTRTKEYLVQAEEFSEKFFTGDNLPQKSPILSIRNTFMSVKPGQTIERNRRVYMIARTWNAFVENQELSRAMRVPPKNFELPVIHGADM